MPSSSLRICFRRTNYFFNKFKNPLEIFRINVCSLTMTFKSTFKVYLLYHCTQFSLKKIMKSVKSFNLTKIGSLKDIFKYLSNWQIQQLPHGYNIQANSEDHTKPHSIVFFAPDSCIYFLIKIL